MSVQANRSTWLSMLAHLPANRAGPGGRTRLRPKTGNLLVHHVGGGVFEQAGPTAVKRGQLSSVHPNPLDKDGRGWESPARRTR